MNEGADRICGKLVVEYELQRIFGNVHFDPLE